MKTYRQGDCFLFELPINTENLSPIARQNTGLVLLDGEKTGHQHKFLGRRTEMFTPYEVGTPDTGKVARAKELLASLPAIDFDSIIGIVKLSEADALIHPEHAEIEFPAGTTLVAVRQREYTPAGIVNVAD